MCGRGYRPTAAALTWTRSASGRIFYNKLPNWIHVNHSQGEYVQGEVHVNGLESFWALVKRGYYGTYHQWHRRHIYRYINEFSGRHNIRPLDTEMRMTVMVQMMVGKVLPYRVLAPRRPKQLSLFSIDHLGSWTRR